MSRFDNGEDESLGGEHMEVKTRSIKSRLPPEKVMSWFLQSKLANIKNITVGIRDQHIVKRLENHSIEDLQRQYFKATNFKHDFDISLNSIHFYLDQIKTYFHRYLRTSQALIIERKPNSLDVECFVEAMNPSSFFSKEFQDFYGPNF